MTTTLDDNDSRILIEINIEYTEKRRDFHPMQDIKFNFTDSNDSVHNFNGKDNNIKQ